MNIHKAPIIEIHGTGVHNRGAELMAISISEKIKSVYPNAQIIVPCTFGHPLDIKKYGFKTALSLETKNKKYLYSLLMSILNLNFVPISKIDVILDASGFAFSDQWGAWAAKKLVQKANKSTRKKQPLILMPQALGPFQKNEIKKWTNLLFNRAEIIFARDKQSFDYSTVLASKDKLLKCPDFTVGLEPMEVDISLPKKFACIVPNIRMLDKTNSSENYLNFIKKSVDSIENLNIEPVFLIHDGEEDLKVVSLLGEKYQKIRVIQHDNPKALKWILGKSQFVIGSRFHALVSSLSQAVPCIGVGWSHKYEELFIDFNTKETLIKNLEDLEKLEFIIQRLADVEQHKDISEKIKIAANKIKQEVEHMWNMVLQIIDRELQKK